MNLSQKIVKMSTKKLFKLILMKEKPCLFMNNAFGINVLQNQTAQSHANLSWSWGIRLESRKH